MIFVNLKTGEKADALPSGSVLCLGNFDGVHIGHRQLVAAVLSKYEQIKENNKDLICGAWFFDSAFYKNTGEIYSVNEKLCVFSELGLDYAIIANFDELKSLSPEAFVNEILKCKCKCVHAVCGENFRFGSKAAGDHRTLTKLMNGNTTVVPLLSVNNGMEGNDSVIVSSTYIRSLLADGNVSKANSLLGKPYQVIETVIHGKALGRKLGIPTINQNVQSKAFILKNGIYSTVCTVDGIKYFGVTNVGVRPTVDNNGHKNIETHIIDFDGDCYGKSVKIEFISRLRDEMKFESIEALKTQINKDILATKYYFSK